MKPQRSKPRCAVCGENPPLLGHDMCPVCLSTIEPNHFLGRNRLESECLGCQALGSSTYYELRARFQLFRSTGALPSRIQYRKHREAWKQMHSQESPASEPGNSPASVDIAQSTSSPAPGAVVTASDLGVGPDSVVESRPDSPDPIDPTESLSSPSPAPPSSSGSCSLSQDVVDPENRSFKDVFASLMTRSSPFAPYPFSFHSSLLVSYLSLLPSSFGSVKFTMPSCSGLAEEHERIVFSLAGFQYGLVSPVLSIAERMGEAGTKRNTDGTLPLLLLVLSAPPSADSYSFLYFEFFTELVEVAVGSASSTSGLQDAFFCGFLLNLQIQDSSSTGFLIAPRLADEGVLRSQGSTTRLNPLVCGFASQSSTCRSSSQHVVCWSAELERIASLAALLNWQNQCSPSANVFECSLFFLLLETCTLLE